MIDHMNFLSFLHLLLCCGNYWLIKKSLSTNGNESTTIKVTQGRLLELQRMCIVRQGCLLNKKRPASRLPGLHRSRTYHFMCVHPKGSVVKHHVEAISGTYCESENAYSKSVPCKTRNSLTARLPTPFLYKTGWNGRTSQCLIPFGLAQAGLWPRMAKNLDFARTS